MPLSVGSPARPSADAAFPFDAARLWSAVRHSEDSMSGKRIVFTGGNGQGRTPRRAALRPRATILNVDLKPLGLPGVNTLIADITDTGQAFNALTTHSVSRL